jgi:hypothetical protein
MGHSVCYSCIPELYVLVFSDERNVFDKFTSKEIRIRKAVQFECIATSETAETSLYVDD